MSQPIRLQHRLEYAALRALASLLQALPGRMAMCVGYGLAALSHWGLRFRVSAARARIREVLGDDLPAGEVRRIAWLSWRNLCFNVVEILRMPKVDRAWVDRHVQVRGLEPVLQRQSQGEGAVLATFHMGNWDLSGIGAHLLGVPIFFIARRQKNPLTDAFLNQQRGVTGVDTILSDEKNLLRNVIRRLKKGRILAILPDVRARTPALSVPYLGKRANLAGGSAVFARQTGVPIYPVIARRAGWMQHQWDIYEPIWPDPSQPKDEDIARMMEQLMAVFEREVRATPEQYFWYNKRWVLEPMETDGESEQSGERERAGHHAGPV